MEMKVAVIGSRGLQVEHLENYLSKDTTEIVSGGARGVAIIGIGFVLSVLALSQGSGMLPLVVTVLYAFLSIRMEGASILDFMRCAVCFLFLRQQYYEWRCDRFCSENRRRSYGGTCPPGSSWVLTSSPKTA